MSKSKKVAKNYAVELFVKMITYKGRTFKGLVVAKTKDEAQVISIEQMCLALVSQSYPCRNVDIKVKSCVEYSDFRFYDGKNETGIMEAKDE